jgi:hypothetical protein
MNPTCLPKEVLLPDRACWDTQGTKGSRIHYIVNPAANLFGPLKKELASKQFVVDVNVK